MNEVFQSYLKFLSTNEKPEANKILVSVLVVASFALVIFILSGILKYMRKINLLKVKNYSVKMAVIWISGAVLLDLLLMATQIVNYNVVSFMVIAMAWDNLYQKLYNQAKNRELSSIDSLEG